MGEFLKKYNIGNARTVMTIAYFRNTYYNSSILTINKPTIFPRIKIAIINPEMNNLS